MIRLKVTPRFTEDGIHLTLEWVEVGEGEKILDVVGTEEFALASAREGCAYISRAAFEAGQLLPGTFWVDEVGRRHFVMQADPGVIGTIGAPIGG